MATILVVEDRDVDREFLTTLLGYRGHRVVAASDGLQALDVVERTRPDLVISDILMPSVDGYELVRRLRDMPFVGATPVMFYTATYHEREARALATQCGVVDILTKPSDPEVILARIDELLRQPRVPEAPLVPASFHRAHAAVLGAKLDERERKLTDQKERMASLVALCRDLTIERDPPSVLSLVCKEARAMMLAQVAAIGLLSDDGVDARVSVASGAEIGRLGALPRHAIDDDTLRRVVERREAVRRSDASGDTRTIGLNGTATPVFSYLAVPLASP
ncbi:MAG TPA: response regulator, partial [Vicinamibacterales bacterium]|nr:response regulator [Vicinamibacterales bacterium]